MQLTCKLCRFRFDFEDQSATETRCPRCEGKVKIDPAQTPQTASQVPLGCPGCLNLLNPSDTFPVTCRYCGHKIEKEQGEKLGQALKGLEARLNRFLMAGGAASEASAQIQSLGVNEEQAFAYVDKLVLEIPFQRHPLWKKSERVTMSSSCDSCGVAGQLAPYQATWNIREEELNRYREGWGGFMQGELQSKKALYFLCKNCSKLPPQRFAGGYPARNGFLYSRLETVKDAFPAPDPVEPLVLSQVDQQG